MRSKPGDRMPVETEAENRHLAQADVVREIQPSEPPSKGDQFTCWPALFEPPVGTEDPTALTDYSVP
jgi:hypothetical protein